ncbi:MAG: aspartate kinase [Clostridia bacterium]
MEVKVMKFGGSSIANNKCIKRVGDIIKRHSEMSKLIIVLSAQKGVTDDLIKRAKQIQKQPDAREMDMLISTGEQISIALLTMHLKSINIKAVSLTASQIKLTTDAYHTNARIKSLTNNVLVKYLKGYDVLIVAGFQGITRDDQITTLGRGGSDLTAIAIASSLNLDEVNIYSDVEGVYSTDPNQNIKAVLIRKISYQEMLEMASSGAKVINNRAVELAAKKNIKIKLYSTSNEVMGTEINEVGKMEEKKITGVVSKNDLAILCIKLREAKDNLLSQALNLISLEDINIDLFTYDQGILKLVIKEEMLDKIDRVFSKDYDYKVIGKKSNLVKVSVIGLGMIRQPGIAAQVAKVLDKENVNIELISCSEINISILISKVQAKNAIEKLHEKLIEKEYHHYEKNIQRN